jgi:ABC-type phosphate transport system permease subunit
MDKHGEPDETRLSGWRYIVRLSLKIAYTVPGIILCGFVMKKIAEAIGIWGSSKYSGWLVIALMWLFWIWICLATRVKRP